MHSFTLRAALPILAALALPAVAQDQVVLHDSPTLRGALQASEPDALVLDCSGWRVRVPLTRVAAVRHADGRLRVPLAEHFEDLGLRAGSRGRPVVAMGHYARALDAVLAAAARVDLGPQETVLVEVYLRRLGYFATRHGSPLDVIDAASRVLEAPGLKAASRGFARWARSSNLRAYGRAELARADERVLGLIQNYYLVGPFDNERGTGFNTAHGPEKQAFDPSATFPGKKHTVGWRRQPVPGPPGGIVDLDTLFRPNDQALAYALTYLHSERGGPVALRLGSDEAVKLWVNGQRLLSRKLRRSEQADQDHVGVVLEKGWNQVLLKVCDQTGDWAFRLRVSAPDGGPAEGVRGATYEEIAAAPEFRARAATVEVVPGTIALARTLALAHSQDWRAWFHLGYLQLVTGAHDQSEHPDRDAFQRAVGLSKDQGRSFLQVFLSFANTGRGEFSVNREDNARRTALEAACADPNNARARVLLAGYYANQLGNRDRARALVAQALKIAPGYLDAQLMSFDLESRRGLSPLSRARLLEVYEQTVNRLRAEEIGALPPALLREVLQEAQSSGDVERQKALLGQLLETQRGSEARWLIALANLHEAASRHEPALTLRRQAVRIGPFSLTLRLQLAKHLQRLGQLEEAAGVLQAALELSPQDDDLVEALGHVQDRRGLSGEADALYRRAMDLNPNRVELAKYLEFRNRRQAKTRVRFEDAWAVDPAPLVAKVKAEPRDARRTHRTLFHQEVARVNADGTKSEFVQEVFRIENRAGARDLATYAAYFQSDQHIEFQRARVYFADGRVEDAPVGSSTGRARGEFTSGRRYPVRFPPLSPGDVIAVRYRTDDLEQGFFGDYYGKIAYFQRSTRLDWMRYVLIAPKRKELHFHTPGLKIEHQTREDGDWTVHVFEKRDIPPLESEPNMPWAKEVVPQVQVSTFKDWDAFARWYWGLVSSQHEADDQIKAKVAELTRGAKTTAEKVRRIYNYVVTDIRYNASWEFGIHGFKPYNATKIYARKFGDCKDKATLIGTMCKAVGVEAWPVLIFGEDRRGREDLSLPLMSHFNHCISWVDVAKEGTGGGIFLDGTAEHHPYATLPTMDYGAKVVVITPQKGVVREIPFRDPAANSIRERSTVQVQPGGKATLQTVMDGTGTYGVILRDILQNEGRRKETIEPQVGKRFGGAHVQAVRTSDLSNLDLPVQVEVDVDLPKVLHEAPDGSLELRPVRSWLFDAVYLRGQGISDLAADSERTQDVILPVPSGVDEEVTYELPPDLRIERLPQATRLDLPFASFQLEYEQDGPKVRVRRSLRFKTNRIEKKDYEAFRKFVRDVARAEAERPILRDQGGEQ